MLVICFRSSVQEYAAKTTNLSLTHYSPHSILSNKKKDNTENINAWPADGKGFLVDHQFFQGIEISGDERTDWFVVISEDLLASAFWPHRAGGPYHPCVWSAVTLQRIQQQDVSAIQTDKIYVLFFFFCMRTNIMVRLTDEYPLPKLPLFLVLILVRADSAISARSSASSSSWTVFLYLARFALACSSCKNILISCWIF